MENKRYINVINCFFLFILCWFQYRVWFNITGTDLLYFGVEYVAPSSSGIMAGILLGILINQVLVRYAEPLNICKALAPVLLLLPWFVLPFSLWILILIIVITAFCLVRLLITLPVPKFIFCRDRKHISLIVISLMTIAFVTYQIWLYDRAWRCQYLFFFDWGMFLAPSFNTLRGEFMTDYWEIAGESFFSRHFQPGFFVWFIPLLALFPYPQTMMVVGALFLGGSALLIYYFARTRKLPPVMSAGCALIYLLYPSISNYNLSIFYGFHVIYFFIPVFILFCCLYEKKKWKFAFIVFLFSLTIKKTVGSFWVGWGICQFLTGHRKRGIIYALIGGLYLIFCLKFIIPYFSSNSGYLYQTTYAFLGDSIWEIALSPVLRPVAFWGMLLQEKNILLLLFLSAAFIPAILSKPFWVGCGAVVAAFALLYNSDARVNFYNQYTVELSILFCLAFIAAVSKYYRHEPDKFAKWFLLGLPPVKRYHFAWALLAAGIVSTLSSHFLMAEAIYTKNNSLTDYLLGLPDRTAIRSEISHMVPDGAFLSCNNERLGSLMLGSGKKLTRGEQQKDCDYFLFDILDQNAGTGVELYHKMLTSPEFNIIWRRYADNNYYLLFKRGAPPVSNNMKEMDAQEWIKTGSFLPLPSDQDTFEVRINYFNKNNRLVLQYSIKLLKEIHNYYKITTFAANNGQIQHQKTMFGDGLIPYDRMRPGTVFQFEMPLPENWSKFEQSGCKFEPMK